MNANSENKIKLKDILSEYDDYQQISRILPDNEAPSTLPGGIKIEQLDQGESLNLELKEIEFVSVLKEEPIMNDVTVFQNRTPIGRKSKSPCITGAMRRSKKILSSWVWKYFIVCEDDNSRVVCKECGQVLTRGTKGQSTRTFNTTNMISHIKCKHKDIAAQVDELRKKTEVEKTTKKLDQPFIKHKMQPSTSQPTLVETLERNNTWKINDQRATAIHVLLAEMIAIDLQPFSILEDLGFQRLLNYLCPNYNIPSRYYLEEIIFQNIYDKIKIKIENEIKEALFVSFTLDGWTTTVNNSYFISLTGHWLSSDFEQKTSILRVIPLNESHTAANVSDCIQTSLNTYNIPASKVHVFIRNDAKNMEGGIKNSGYFSLPCFLHTLQLVLNDALFSQVYVNNIISVCKSIVGHFNHSPSAFNTYMKYQVRNNVPQNKFIPDIATRWNSQFLMLERIFEQKDALIPYLCDYNNLRALETDQWHILEKIVYILKNFYELIENLSKKEALVSSIIPAVTVVNNFFEKAELSEYFNGLGTTISAWKVSSKDKFSKYLYDKNTILSTVLDPRYMTLFFNSDEFEGDIMNTIVKWMVEDIVTFHKMKNIYDSTSTSWGNSPSETAEVMTSSNIEDVSEEVEFSFSSCFEDIVKGKIDKDKEKSKSSKSLSMSQNVKRSIEDEMEKYFSYGIIGKNECPLTWWRNNKSHFNNLPILAHKYLSAPPTSIESERLFSSGGLTYSPRQNRITPDTGEKILFLHHYLRALNLKH